MIKHNNLDIIKYYNKLQAFTPPRAKQLKVAKAKNNWYLTRFTLNLIIFGPTPVHGRLHNLEKSCHAIMDETPVN